MGKNDAVIKSGQIAKSVDKLVVNGTSGHVSGHDFLVRANSYGEIG